MRALERAAALGDQDAAERLDRERRRCSGPRGPHDHPAWVLALPQEDRRVVARWLIQPWRGVLCPRRGNLSRVEMANGWPALREARASTPEQVLAELGREMRRRVRSRWSRWRWRPLDGCWSLSAEFGDDPDLCHARVRRVLRALEADRAGALEAARYFGRWSAEVEQRIRDRRDDPAREELRRELERGGVELDSSGVGAAEEAWREARVLAAVLRACDRLDLAPARLACWLVELRDHKGTLIVTWKPGRCRERVALELEWAWRAQGEALVEHRLTCSRCSTLWAQEADDPEVLWSGGWKATEILEGWRCNCGHVLQAPWRERAA